MAEGRLLVGSTGDGRVDDLRLRLENIAEELADLSMDVLREAIDGGATKRPPQEKSYSQARRAVEKAARLLGSTSDQ